MACLRVRFNLRGVAKSGEIMMNAKQVLRSEPEAVTPHFRLWKNGGYSQPFVRTNHADRPPVVFVGVSIMSALFIQSEPASYMMSQTDQAYGNEDIPIVYVCGDTLQLGTEVLLHGNKAEKSISNARSRWQKNYESAFEKGVHDGIKSNHVTAYWDQLTRHARYPAIRKFVDIIMTSAVPTAESLQEVFPDASPSVLTELCNDICQINIAVEVQANADYFADRNQKPLQVQRIKEKSTYDSVYKNMETAHKRGLSNAPLPPYENSDEKIEQNQKREVESATYRYLAEEFAAFLLLASLTNAQQIASELGLKSKSRSAIVLPDQAVRPVLAYPISASSNAENTFKAFARVECLYHKYAELLGLPVIEELLTIIDSYVPQSVKPGLFQPPASPVSLGSHESDSENKNKNKNKNKLLVITEKPTVFGCLMPEQAAQSAAAGTEVIRYSDSPTEFPRLSDSPSTSVVNRTLSNAGHTIMFASVMTTEERQQQAQQVEKITDKIFSIVQTQSRLPGDKKRAVYQNGITCKIKVTKIPQEAQGIVEIHEALSEQEKEEQKQATHELIKEVVSSAVIDLATDETEFVYNGHQYVLRAAPTSSAELKEQGEEAVVSKKSFSVF